MRMIDADALIVAMLDHGVDHVQTEDLEEINQIINDAPTVDAVPVVRCRGCEHCDDKTPYELWCLGRGWPLQMVPPDGFCDKGRRRDGE